jgi:chromosome segregation ATPase
MKKEQLDELRDKLNNLKSRRALIHQMAEEKKKEYLSKLDELQKDGFDLDVSEESVTVLTEKLDSLCSDLFTQVSQWEDVLNEAQKRIM